MWEHFYSCIFKFIQAVEGLNGSNDLCVEAADDGQRRHLRRDDRLKTNALDVFRFGA